MAQNAVQDANQHFSQLFTQGTAGTADIKGTAGVVAGAANPATGAQYVEVLNAIPIELGSVDIEIGAVEIKDGTTDTRAKVGTTNNDLFVTLATRLDQQDSITSYIAPLSGVVLAGTIAVGTTATAIPVSALTSRKSMIIYNQGTAPIYLGGSGVGTSTGLPLGTADYSPSFDLGTTILYGICATAGGTARVLEVS